MQATPSIKSNLEKPVESRKSTQDLDAPDKIKNTLFTNQVTTELLISPCTSISSTSFSRSSDFPRLNDEERNRCEVWTRVMGYHRPVSSFNPGKQSEHAERLFFNETKRR